jgi:glycosyltransferase involved in cell wall biosynthesis
MKPKFSVVCIVKNESKTLPRLIGSLKDFQNRGGEIVIVDTGSQDDTVKIAKELGCNVFEAGEQFVFTIDEKQAKAINDKFVVEGEENIVNPSDKFFDFSKARNYAASLASNDWICYCDADEVLAKLDIDKINKIIVGNPEVGQLEYEFIFAKDNFGNRAIVLRQSKFYDRYKMKWAGTVHECLTNLSSTIPYYLSEDIFLLEHYQNQETNRHTYLKGLAVDCYFHLENDRNSHYLARELMYNNHPKSAICEFQRHIQMNRWPAERAQSYIHMGDCYGMINDPKKQIESYQQAINIDGSRREAWLKLAGFYKHNKDPQRTACYAKAALQIPHNFFYANNMADYTYEPHRLLYWAYGWLGDIAAAQHHILLALKYLPVDKNILEDTKYYFEYAAPDIEGWMTFPELTWLYEQGKKYKTIAEIGSWAGRSTHALLSGNSKVKGGIVTAIDTWQGSKDTRDETNWRAKQKDMFSEFKKNVGHFKNLDFIIRPSLEAVEACPDNGVDMVFIDAGHTYEEVKADILAWLPKAKKIISGHDYKPDVWMGVVQAVDEIFGKPDGVEDSIWWIDLEKRREKQEQKIPKQIYSVWFSEEPIPQQIQKILDSQKIEGYKHILFTLDTMPACQDGYFKEAIKAKKWVKACDYLRAWVLYNFGGIFLDADMEILPGKNFDDMLNDKMFVGREENGFLGYSLVGSMPKHPAFKEYLETVVKNFKGDDDKFFESSQELFSHLVLEEPRKDVKVYPALYFFPYNWQKGSIDVKPYTKTFHHFYHTWQAEQKDYLPSVSIIIPHLSLDNPKREEGLNRILKSIDNLFYPKHLIQVIVEEGEESVPVKVKNAFLKATGDWIAYLANDAEMTPNSLYNAIKTGIKENKALISFFTGENLPDEGNICEHFIIRKDFISKLENGEIFSTKYNHTGVDNYLWEQCKKLNQAIQCKDAIVYHYHFSKGAEFDVVYQRGWSNAQKDRELLAKDLAKLNAN